jgi:hypothetical protein
MRIPRRCSGCGAALGDPTDDDLTIVCGFCGLRHDLDTMAGAAAPVVIDVGAGARRLSRLVIAAVLLLVGVPVAIGVYISLQTANALNTTVRVAVDEARSRAAEARRPIAPAELATLTDFAWKTVDVPPPPGGFAAFEPVSALPWALTIGRAWASDAVVTRIDVGRVSATGVVDLSGEQTSGYRFASPGRRARWKQETDAGTKSTTAAALMLQIQGETVRAIVDSHDREPQTAPAAASLPLPDILARARRSKTFGERPFYGGYLIHLPPEGWVWYLSTPSGDTFPRVRARDGQVFPY